MRVIRLLPILVTAPALLGACSTRGLPTEPGAGTVTAITATVASPSCDAMRSVATVQASPSARPTRDDAPCDQAGTTRLRATPVDPSGHVRTRSASASQGSDAVGKVPAPATRRHSGVYATSW
jgi:hypothetical protein